MKPRYRVAIVTLLMGILFAPVICAEIQIGGGAVNFTGFVPAGRLYISLFSTPLGVIGLDNELWWISGDSQMLFPALSFTHRLSAESSKIGIDAYGGAAPLIAITNWGFNFSGQLIALRTGLRASYGIVGAFAEAHLLWATPDHILGTPYFSFGGFLSFGRPSPVTATPTTEPIEPVQSPPKKIGSTQPEATPKAATPAKEPEVPTQETQTPLESLASGDSYFLSGGLAKFQSLSFIEISLGYRISEKWSLLGGGGIAMGQRLMKGGTPISLGGFNLGGLLLYSINENLRLGVGGGMLHLQGIYEAGTSPADSSFTISPFYISAALGFQWKFMLFTIGVNLVL